MPSMAAHALSCAPMTTHALPCAPMTTHDHPCRPTPLPGEMGSPGYLDRSLIRASVEEPGQSPTSDVRRSAPPAGLGTALSLVRSGGRSRCSALWGGHGRVHRPMPDDQSRAVPASFYALENTPGGRLGGGGWRRSAFTDLCSRCIPAKRYRNNRCNARVM
jgi:hypothetical protein